MAHFSCVPDILSCCQDNTEISHCGFYEEIIWCKIFVSTILIVKIVIVIIEIQNRTNICIGGSRGAPPAPPPNRIQFFRFHMFLPKSAHIGGWHSPQWLSTPPTRNPGSAIDMEASEQFCSNKIRRYL